ncbi:MAG TPA: replication initiator [Jiangellaceae bacterium]
MTTASMLALTPEDTTSGAGASTDTTTPWPTSAEAIEALKQGFDDDLTVIEHHEHRINPRTFPSPTTRPFNPVQVQRNTAFARGTRPDYERWINHVTPAGECAHPVVLRGTSLVIDKTTGEVLSSRSTEDMPDKAIYKACGNRRISVCPACAEVYRQDTYQLVLSGLVGGKGVPQTVQTHPSAFPTFTAPSFGLVHSRWAKHDEQAKICRPRRKPDPCPHGIDQRCFQRHHEGEKCLGQPLCLDCYDHLGQVVWNLMAGELWRRTMDKIKKTLQTWAKAHDTVIQLAYAKVAEMQNRGVAHFHALMRLDGLDSTDRSRVVPPLEHASFAILDDAIRHAVATTRFRTPKHPDSEDGWLIEWGQQLDVKPVRLSAKDAITETQVAGYLAKYSTKATEAAGHTSMRLTPATVGDHGRTDTHVGRLILACWKLGRSGANLDPEQLTKNSGRFNYRRLRRWAHMLGFGGHFSTKSRKYSTTLRALREVRLNWRREHHRTAEHTDDIETTLIVGHFSYAATGWHTTGDELLARTAAAQAREHRRVAREELEALYLN